MPQHAAASRGPRRVASAGYGFDDESVGDIHGAPLHRLLTLVRSYEPANLF